MRFGWSLAERRTRGICVDDNVENGFQLRRTRIFVALATAKAESPVEWFPTVFGGRAARAGEVSIV